MQAESVYFRTGCLDFDESQTADDLKFWPICLFFIFSLNLPFQGENALSELIFLILSNWKHFEDINV